jgi:hypothetical protein
VKLTVKHWDGKNTFEVEVASTDYVDDLKDLFEITMIFLSTSNGWRIKATR